MDEKAILELCGQIRQTAYDLHEFLRSGHLEKVYENGLTHRLQKAGLNVEQQHQLKVYDQDGTVLGEYFADLLIESELIVEMKAGKAIADEHIAQTLGYLRASGHRHALLINFGAQKIQFKKLIL